MTRPHWDTEEVLAFVHDVRSWRDLNDGERAEWCRRLQHVRDNVTDANGKAWTEVRLAALFGMARTTLRHRFATVEAISNGGDRPVGRSNNEQVGDARRAMRNPNITPQQKAALVAEADDETKRAIRAALDDGSNPRPPRISDRGRTEVDLADDAYWAKVRAALHLLLDVKLKISRGEVTVPGDIAILMELLVPETDWDEALRSEIGNLQ